ncbi:MFS transporter [Tabrizicola sp. J26]|uniref:MFS transporter n=1 Tax=Alitabrizicola rongguiensis TaxID=2909234 RepID=UPI001F1ECE83|nr:MFS transporter [Tabrizicola rongguiensis]MCF1707879.1 MFS transporter [Tabrizicola rongguiensis]
MTAKPSAAKVDRARPMTAEEKKVILASSLGTVFEWYDFYLYGSLAKIIGAQFFSAFPEATQGIFALLAFAAGFLVRPFGALVFGSLGDLIGRKYTFLVTILIMGLSTFIVGLLPGSESIGIAAPIILIALRMLQGLALGGEYGGAAVYVAEHAPNGRRGYYTSWIQTTATLGLFLSLIVILVVTSIVNSGWAPTELLKDGQPVMGPDGKPTMVTAFQSWGWRIPFLLSAALLGVSLYIRLTMEESPVFKKMKAEGATSKAPLREAFGQWKNAKFAVIALLGLVAGQAVVWYSGQFYALFFLQSVAKVDSFTANILIAVALALGTMFFVYFGSLSDKIGRKPVILAGLLLACVTYFPVFKYILATANPALDAAQRSAQVIVTADPNECSFQFNPVGTAKFTTSCDQAKALLGAAAVNYTTVDAPAGTPASVSVNGTVIPGVDTAGMDEAAAKTAKADFSKAVNAALIGAGYPMVAAENTTVVKIASFGDVFKAQSLKLIVVLWYLILLVTMVYGPIAAALVELFPTRIRYSGMSLPYHIGNGWFGGLLPATAAAIALQVGNVYSGLWYAIIVAAGTFIIGLIFVPQTHQRDIFSDEFNRR